MCVVAWPANKDGYMYSILYASGINCMFDGDGS